MCVPLSLETEGEVLSFFSRCWVVVTFVRSSGSTSSSDRDRWLFTCQCPLLSEFDGSIDFSRFPCVEQWALRSAVSIDVCQQTQVKYLFTNSVLPSNEIILMTLVSSRLT